MWCIFTTMKTQRATFSFPEPLYERMKQAAADEGKERGEPVPLSEWLRGVVEAALAAK